MPQHHDDLSPTSTSDLRSLAMAYFPRSGVSRMTRPELVPFFLSQMAAEEASSFAAKLRRSRRQGLDDDMAEACLSIHRRMRERYGQQLFGQYLLSEARLSEPQLSTYIRTAPASDTAVSRSTIRISAASPPAHQADPVPSSAPPEMPSRGPIRLPEDSRSDLADHWPQLVPQEHKIACYTAFLEGTKISPGPTCAICARRTFTRDPLFTPRHLQTRRVATHTLPLDLLKIDDPHILSVQGDWFRFDDASLNGHALERTGIHITPNSTEADVCNECLDDLTRLPPRLPALSLANGNIRGFLPPNLRDCTWLEERLCARYLGSAYVVRMYDVTRNNSKTGPEHDTRPRVMRGHTCAFPLNVIATAQALPWSFDSLGPLVSCLVMGPYKPRPSDLRKVFQVRREKVRQLLLFLRDNFQGYPQFEIDERALQALPEEGVPEALMQQVIHEPTENSSELFDQETAGLEAHPALLEVDEAAAVEGTTYIEHHGLVDVNGVGVSADARIGAALANATGGERPDLIIKHGSSPINDYNNPELFPGMYPLLFPWGTGGFEAHRRRPLSFNRQAAYSLDLADPAFRRHWSYVFAVANIQQRRTIHWGSKVACSRRDYARVSRALKDLDAETVKRVSEHLSLGGNMSSLSQDEKRVCTLLKKCELLSVNVPGSKAMMDRARANIRSFIGEFGIFQLFLTLNPHPEYAPIFQVFHGAEEIDLSLPAPLKSKLSKRLAQVADDPVAAADYFHFQIAATFQYLFGWDVRAKRSSAEGGILGRLSAFFMVREHTMRGQLHGHILIWLEGGLNPRPLRTKLAADDEFRERYLSFLDDTIWHHLPGHAQEHCTQPANPEVASPEHLDDDYVGAGIPSVGSAPNPREMMPPDPAHPNFLDHFERDHRLLGEVLQRHKHRKTCYKGGRKTCRFLFPHEEQEQTVFDEETKTVAMRVLDAWINWHLPWALVPLRHNMDSKWVQSGLGSAAAAAYITGYACKSDETPNNQVKMISTVFQRVVDDREAQPELKKLLVRCVMQYGRERQLHAQQVATYVRELGDVWQSHTTVPMLSASILGNVFRMYGEPRSDVPPCPEPAQQTADVSAASGGDDQQNVRDDVASDDQAIASDEDDVDADGGDELLTLDAAGTAHQVVDYLHRGTDLEELNFYDFVKYVQLVPKPKRKNILNYHSLDAAHPNFKTHAHRYTPDQPRGIPRAIYTAMPRPNGSSTHGDRYCAAMLAHFQPFSISRPLKPADCTYEQQFNDARFSARSLEIMENWRALAECDDAKDREQLLRRRREAARSAKHDRHAGRVDGGLGLDDPDADVHAASLAASSARLSSETVALLNGLSKSGWFFPHRLQTGDIAPVDINEQCPLFTSSRRRQWIKEQEEIEVKERQMLSMPKASYGVLAEDLCLEQDIGPTSSATTLDDLQNEPPAETHPSTERRIWHSLPPHILIEQLAQERGLNESQTLAFRIVARHFFQEHFGAEQAPLRMLMHGAAGTGKTVVVRLLRELLDRYGKGNEIIFMAPTGKAACAIGGVTQHSAFSLSIDKRKKAVSNEDLGRVQDPASARRMKYLQDKFSGIRWIFFDEVSMTSCEIMAEIDQALKTGTKNDQEPFGGLNVVFAGDLCQLPPVASAPLYNDKSSPKQSGEARTKIGLGRAAWLQVGTVVEFKEQMRMTDPDMAAALARMRLRQCLPADAELFNRNLLPQQPSSVQCATAPPHADAIVLARTNEAVRVLNTRKAQTQAETRSSALVVSHALDTSSAAIDADTRQTLLAYNGSAMDRGTWGRVPLFLGMPVVYRGPNSSVTLGVTNGATGTVVGWDLARDEHGLTVPRGIVLRFSEEANWALTGLGRGCLPIDPIATRFKFTSRGADQEPFQVSRKQLPLRPAFAMTIHSAQGITNTTGIIVDLREGGFEAYVAASRATKREHVFLVAPVTAACLNHPPLPNTLLNELTRLEHLAESAQAQHDHDRWRLDGFLKRPATSTSVELPAAKRPRTDLQRGGQDEPQEDAER